MKDSLGAALSSTTLTAFKIGSLNVVLVPFVLLGLPVVVDIVETVLVGVCVVLVLVGVWVVLVLVGVFVVAVK